MNRIVTVVLAVSLLAPAGVARKKHKLGPGDIGNGDPGKGVNFYSIEREMALGKEMALEVELESRILRDPVVSEYVNRLGQNIVRNSDAKVPFTIKVIESDDVNAFALPGGFMFVNTGLVLKAGNEAELAGVMAHEIAHVAARHGTKQATRGQLINYASIPLIFMGGWVGYAVRQAADIAVPMGFLEFSRAMEMEADYLGLGYVYKAGYDPTSFVDFFEKIESINKKRPGTVAKLFSTHPMNGTRIRAAQKEIQDKLSPREEYVIDTSEFQNIHRRLDMIENRGRITRLGSRPELRHRNPAGTAPNGDSTSGGDDERPTLKRRE